jgi:hypothetical protein
VSSRSLGMKVSFHHPADRVGSALILGGSIADRSSRNNL